LISGSGGAVEENPIERSEWLANLYQSIEDDLSSLREYLHDEFASSEPFVHELLEHLSRFRGKQVRPACLFLSARCFGDTGSDHIRCGAVVELIHTATLVHDDLLDQAEIRRRVETIHNRYGDRAAILLGDIIYARGFVISTEVAGAARLLADCTRDICIGEMMQVGNAGNLNLTEEEYFQIIHRKTAILYGLSCKLGALLSGATETQVEAMERFGNLLGTAFQIADDALDVTGDPQQVGKSLGTDLANQKLTLPMILLRDGLDQQGKAELLSMLAAAEEFDFGSEPHRQLQKMLDQQQILNLVFERAEDLTREAIEVLHGAAPKSPARDALEQLAEFVVQRKL
jgi:octaprenyl-diphosphate synthase